MKDFGTRHTSKLIFRMERLYRCYLDSLIDLDLVLYAIWIYVDKPRRLIKMWQNLYNINRERSIKFMAAIVQYGWIKLDDKVKKDNKLKLAMIRQQSFICRIPMSKNIIIDDLNEKKIAMDLTSFEYKLLARVTPQELITNQLTGVTKHFDNISRWVINEILVDDNATQLYKLAKFITIAYELRSLKNYNTLMSIMCGINNSSVSRLTYLWKALPPPLYNQYIVCDKVCNACRNHIQYRSEFDQASFPKLPCIGILARDIYFIVDTHPKYREGKINRDLVILITKCLKLYYDCIEKGRSYIQNSSLSLNPAKLSSNDDFEDLYNRSLKYKPIAQ